MALNTRPGFGYFLLSMGCNIGGIAATRAVGGRRSVIVTGVTRAARERGSGARSIRLALAWRWVAVVAIVIVTFIGREAVAAACVTNLDCSGTTPICDPSSLSCRGCASTLECTAKDPLRPNCDSSGGATRGSCFSCVSSPAECQAPAPLCQTGTLLCVACLGSSDCSGATPVCNVMQGQCVACQGDFGSDAGVLTCSNPQRPACQSGDAGSLSGECSQCSASDPALCAGSTPVCVVTQGQCGCTQDSNCPDPKQFCDPTKGASGQCVTGCKVNPVGKDACPAGQYCDVPDGGTIGACVQGCSANADCTQAPNVECDLSRHTCVQCLSSSDCVAPLVCDPAGQCVLPDGGAGDGGTLPEAGGSPDAGGVDAGGDSGVDSGEADSGGASDAAIPDASSPDATALDGGSESDAGPMDATVADAALPDASAFDATASDATLPPRMDSGPSPLPSASDFGSPGIIEGGGCSCSLLDTGPSTMPLGGFGVFFTLFIWVGRRRSRKT